MDDAQRTLIQHVAEPIFLEASTELVELSCARQGRQWVIRLLVDKAGGVTVRDCARLNQRIGQALEEANCLEDSYTLEVSSPGLNRPLMSKRDFERALGEALDLELREPLRGSRALHGKLLAVQPEAVVLITPGGNLTIPLAQIQHAKKAIRFSRTP